MKHGDDEKEGNWSESFSKVVVVSKIVTVVLTPQLHGCLVGPIAMWFDQCLG